MASVLVTGGSGFVGRTLLPVLCRAGFRDLVVHDRVPLPEGTRRAVDEADGTVVELVSDRLPDPARFPDLRYVICLAGATSVDAALADPRSAVDGNLQIAINLAEWTRSNPLSIRVVYVSSDEVLGDSLAALPESAPLRPTQPYAASKAAAEILLHCYRDVYNLNIATVRSCNLVGPGQFEPKLIPVAVRALLEGRCIPIHGSGEQLREWMAVDDLASAILTLMCNDVPAVVYQAASGVHLSVIRVVELVARELDTPLMVDHVADRKVQDPSYAMSTLRLKGLGWEPQYDPVLAIRTAARALASEYMTSLRSHTPPRSA